MSVRTVVHEPSGLSPFVEFFIIERMPAAQIVSHCMHAYMHEPLDGQDPSVEKVGVNKIKNVEANR